MNNTDHIDLSDDNRQILHRVKFSILLILEIPALLLSLLIFYFFLRNQPILQVPQNCALFILLVVNFIQLSVVLPFSIHFYALDFVRPAVPIYCMSWTFLAYSVYAISEYLMATISVQRHMLVFHSHLLRIRRMRILLHHSPLIFFLIYPTAFYIYAIFIYPCDGTQWDYTSTVCGFANCHLVLNKVLGTFDWIVNNGLPILINALANALLIVRVIRQKRQQQRPVTWKQQRRMTVQLFCISSLYIVGWAPSLIVGLIQILVNPTFLAEVQTVYFIELINIICLLLPWVCIGLVPELLRWIKTICHIAPQRNTVGVITHSLQPTNEHTASVNVPKL